MISRNEKYVLDYDLCTCKTFGGHISIFVTTTNTGTERAKARPKCSLVIPTTPALAPTINIPKSGACPVMPKTVVFKYFSCPAKSMKVITLEDFSQTRTQSRFPCSGRLTTLPEESNPRMSFPTDDVRPDSASCLCLNSLILARPRPLSSSP